jgi:antitoxin ParD1/3/4
LANIVRTGYDSRMSKGATFNVSLTPPLDGFVRSKVQSGAYDSPNEVISQSLRVLQALEKQQVSFWSDVRGKVAVARRQVARGEVVDGEKAMDAILAELDEKPTSKKRRKSAK